MENIVHTQSRPYNPNSNPGPELPLSYEASVAQPPFLPPSDNFTTLAMNKKGNIFRPSLSLFYLFWFLLTFSALHSYHQWTETSKLCCKEEPIYLFVDIWAKENRSNCGRPMREGEGDAADQWEARRECSLLPPLVALTWIRAQVQNRAAGQVFVSHMDRKPCLQRGI